MNPNPYAPPTARVDDVTSTTRELAPKLWNPNAAVNWSLLFSPAFGAWLHMKNWQALGEPQKAKTAKTWIIVSLVLIVGLSVAAGMLPESKGLDAATRSLGLILLIAWYASSGRAQATLVKQRFGKEYPHKGWTQPLLWALGAVLAFFALVFVLAFVLGMAGAE
jgi:hypothetical protein